MAGITQPLMKTVWLSAFTQITVVSNTLSLTDIANALIQAPVSVDVSVHGPFGSIDADVRHATPKENGGGRTTWCLAKLEQTRHLISLTHFNASDKDSFLLQHAERPK